MEKSFYEEKGRHSGLLAWLLSTDHKRIGIMYLISMTTFFLVGVAIGVLMRLELISPGETIMGAQTYNSLFTL
ncbi:MAG: cytochrome c oxidase subunit I, partial [Calditrichia bacterium]